jgi:hypothetical protein
MEAEKASEVLNKLAIKTSLTIIFFMATRQVKE